MQKAYNKLDIKDINLIDNVIRYCSQYLYSFQYAFYIGVLNAANMNHIEIRANCYNT